MYIKLINKFYRNVTDILHLTLRRGEQVCLTEVLSYVVVKKFYFLYRNIMIPIIMQLGVHNIQNKQGSEIHLLI